MIKCPLTLSTNIAVIYEQMSVPLIQNKVYSTRKEALEARCIDVTLAQSLDNGFVFSANFNEFIINYDMHYQNEQSNSAYFRRHLENVIEIMEKYKLLNGKVVEIGCGKAYFLDMLLNKGVDIIGFDPTYEGNSTGVIKDFFSYKYANIGADLIILRHTMEHISNPFNFIKTIAAANNYKGKLYIEIPSFEWIVCNNATEDIFYEHCNYFTLKTIQMLFKNSIAGYFFNGQYIYVIAELKEVKEEIENIKIEPWQVRFKEKITEYDNLISELKNVAVWGAGAKGSTFLNLLDKKSEKIKCAVDINPRKQHQYIGGTGHYIIKPEEVKDWEIKNIIVMNVNYIEEIRSILGHENNIQLKTLKIADGSN